MKRDEAELLLKGYVKNEQMFKHCLASEAVLRALARRLGRDEEQWGLAGLLHDLDVEEVGGDMGRHGLQAERMLEEAGLNPEICEAVKMHNEVAAGSRRSRELHHALAAGETITGLITATTLVYPDRKIASVKAKSVVKRMKEKAFAASVNRDNIRECECLGLSLDEFAELAVRAMGDISERLGL